MFKRLIEIISVLTLLCGTASAAPDLVVPAPTASGAKAATASSSSGVVETATRLAQEAWTLRHLDTGPSVTLISGGHDSIGLIQPQVAFGARVPLYPLGQQASIWLDPMISVSGRAQVTAGEGGEGELTFRVPLYLGVGIGPLQALDPTQRWSVGIGGGVALNNAWFAASGMSLRWAAPSVELRAGLVPEHPLFEGRPGMKPIQLVELYAVLDAPVTRDDIQYRSFSVGVHLQPHYPR